MSELAVLIEESATRLFEGFAESDAHVAMESGQFPEKLWADFLADGWLRTMLSEDNDGAGLGLAGGMLLMRLAGYYNVPLPVVESLTGLYLAAEAGFELDDELLVPVVLSTVATNDQKIECHSVPWARYAKGLVVAFEENGQSQLVHIKAGQFSLVEGNNMAGEARDDVSFDASLLTSAKPLSNISTEQILSWLALGRAAQMAGALRSVLERTVEYANERSQFGRQIGKFQAVQGQLAVQAEMTSASICAVDAAIKHLGSTEEWELIASAKITTSESAGYASKTAHAVHAAIGFTQEYPLQLSTRRLWSWRDEYGSETQWSAKLGEHCLQLKTDNLWSWLTTQTGS